MSLSKSLATGLLAAAVLTLSGCGEEESLTRDTSPKAIETNQSLIVLKEVGGFAFNDAVLEKLADFGGPTVMPVMPCEDGGTRSDAASTEPGFDVRATFVDCNVDGVKLNGSMELSENGGLHGVKFNGLVVNASYGGQLRMVITGSMEIESSQIGDDQYFDMDIPELNLDATVTQYGRAAPVSLLIRDYSRSRRVNGVTNELSLSVIGRLTKAGDYGSYDVAFSNIPLDAADTARQMFQGRYTPRRYSAGSLYLADQKGLGSWLRFFPTEEYVGSDGVVVEAGEKLHIKANIKGTAIETVQDWELLGLPVLVDIFD